LQWNVEGQDFWWRRAEFDELPTLWEAQNRAYAPEFRETIETFQDRLRNFPDGLWVAETNINFLKSCDNINNENVLSLRANTILLSYTIFHPWKFDMKFPEFSKPLPKFNNFDCVYHHDWCILPEYQGKAIGLNRGMDELVNIIGRELNIRIATAVSVHGFTKTVQYRGWRKSQPLQLLVCPDYGENACAVERYIPDSPTSLFTIHLKSNNKNNNSKKSEKNHIGFYVLGLIGVCALVTLGKVFGGQLIGTK